MAVSVQGLTSAVKGRVVEAGAPDYDESRALYNAMIDKRPAAIAYCVDEADVAAALADGLARRRAVDLRRGHTTFGPQTDDLEIRLGDRPAREHASQGQLRSLVLALKLAELAHIEERLGDAPVLLLDDVPSELDPVRRGLLFDVIGRLDCQTLISVTERDIVPAQPARRDFLVRAGTVAENP